MSNKIKIVTDSTSDFPQEFIEKYDVTVVPLYVNFPEDTYRDQVDITTREFYTKLKESKNILPKTSMPTIQDFIRVYEKILREGYDILSIHISSGLSGTAGVAQTAAGLLQGKIRVFDSKSISLGITLQVLEAVKMIKNNLSLDNIITQLTALREHTEVTFSLDTLEYLEKGGRIGKVSALLGTILNIKPVIRVDNGIYIPLDKVRNQKQAVKNMVNHMLRVLDNKLPKQIAVAHGAAEEAASYLKQKVEEALEIKVDLVKEVGPVIGVHTGPGTLGLTFIY